MNYRYVTLLINISLFTAVLTVPAVASDQDAGTSNISGQMIVAYKDGVSKNDREVLHKDLGLRSIDSLPQLGAEVLVTQSRDADTTVERLRHNPIVRYAERNFYLKLAAIAQTPNDPLFHDQWYLENDGSNSGVKDADIDALNAWKYSTGASSTTVAVIDSGIAYNHPDLKGKLWENPGEAGSKKNNSKDDDKNGYVDDWRGWDWVEDDNDPVDVQKNSAVTGHGTLVAGIIGATGNNAEGVSGVSWKSSLLALAVAEKDGYVKASDLAEAISYAGKAKARVANISIYADDVQDSPSISNAIAGSPETLFVVAAGNFKTDIDAPGSEGFFPCKFPDDNILCVAGTDSKDDLWSSISDGSNYGAESVDIAAPGKSILSTTFTDVVNGSPTGYTYGKKNGTSLAAPLATGTAALLFSYDTTLSVQKAKSLITSTVDKLDSLNGKTVTGGRLNSGKALLKLANPLYYHLIYGPYQKVKLWELICKGKLRYICHNFQNRSSP